MGAGFCSLHREIHYIEVCYIKVWVYYIILDSPRGSVLKYRRLEVLELGIKISQSELMQISHTFKYELFGFSQPFS